MANLLVTVTVTKDNSGVYSFSYAGDISSGTIKVQKGTDFIKLTLSPGTGVNSLAFATPALTWFNSANRAVSINRPIPFNVEFDSGAVVVADNNDGPNSGTFSFLINALANGMLVQSPDPTIVNEGTGGDGDEG